MLKANARKDQQMMASLPANGVNFCKVARFSSQDLASDRRKTPKKMNQCILRNVNGRKLNISHEACIDPYMAQFYQGGV